MKLVLVRHGESVWNKENKFTGWTDVSLTAKGIEEAHMAGNSIKKKDIKFDIVYTSLLKRAHETLEVIMNELNLDAPVVESYKLNERHYGALQGLNKSESAKKYGEDVVRAWRRSYDVRPPELDVDDERFPGNDPKYSGILRYVLPTSESLKDTFKRVVEFYESDISVSLKNGENVLVVAHGNSLRALIKYLENISDEEIPELEIGTCEVIMYDLNENLKITNKEIL